MDSVKGLEQTGALRLGTGVKNLWQDKTINFILGSFKVISYVRIGKYHLAGKFARKNKRLS
jgi:hypothetical protein